MPRLSSRIATIFLLLFAAATVATTSHGDDISTSDQPSLDLPANNLPTLDQLIEATPNIDTSDPETQSFQFTAEIYGPPIDMEMTIAWQRDKLVGARTMLGKDRYPGWFTSNQQTRLFDPCKGRMYKMPQNVPQFSIRVTEDRFIHSFGFEEHSDDETAEPIVLELKSLMRKGRERLRVGRDKHFIWVGVLPTETSDEGEGRMGLLAAYELKAPHKLLQLEIYPAKHHPPGLRISNISYNEEQDLEWPDAPADELLPQEVTIFDLDNDKKISFIDLTEIYAAHSGSPYVQAGLDYESLRDDDRLLGVDWEKTEHFVTQFGPRIATLWKYRPATELIPNAD